MVPLIEQNRVEIEALCRKHRVKRLELFGSAARGDFDPAKSDLDFSYEFPSDDTEDIADRFFGLLEDLERLFKRKIDLVSLKDAKNPYFLASANRHKIVLYAA